MKAAPGHDIHDRSQLVAHLTTFHDWRDIRRSFDGVGGGTSPDPLGWHNTDGGYLIPTSELFAIHDSLERLEKRDVPKVLIVQFPPDTKISLETVQEIRDRIIAALDETLGR